MSLDETRQRAAEQVQSLLGIAADPSQLFGLAAAAFGATRADRCRELAGWARLTRRASATAAVAEMIMAVRRLGSTWWQRERREVIDDVHLSLRETPDAVLAHGIAAKENHSGVGSSLALLGSWACDDAADDEWGQPVDFIDLNDSRADDRVRIPAGAAVGDRLVASYDPGCRVWLDVVERDAEDPALESLGRRRGRVGTVLLAQRRCCDAADAGWAWGMALNGSLLRLPGETPGTDSDPFSRRLPEAVATRLYAGAVELGASADVLGKPWRTNGDLLAGAYRLGWPYTVAGSWHRWGRTVEETVDG